jgi:hypothetical protein
MKFEIKGRPHFSFQLPAEKVEVLRYCAERHYDAVCRSSGEPGGFLWGWLNAANFGMSATATWRDIDTALKIMEYTPPGTHPNRMAIIMELRNAFHRLLDYTNATTRHWKAEFDTAEAR